MNERVRVLLCSKVSQNRIARVLMLDRKTVARKKRFLARVARLHEAVRVDDHLFLDELITFEHTRCKPLAVAMIVNEKRKILAFRVATMPAIGKHLAVFAKKRYGYRPNLRRAAISDLLSEVSAEIGDSSELQFSTDEEPSYGELLRVHFPKAKHQTFPSKRAVVAGQGELKTKEYDPLFPINHTFAMLRDNVASLVRRTWATAKSRQALEGHLAIYADFHNSLLT